MHANGLYDMAAMFLIHTQTSSGAHIPTAAISAKLRLGSKQDTEMRFTCSIVEGITQPSHCRYLNDKLLRDMAGALTANDMEALFKPVSYELGLRPC